jgi:hypothetical protein
MPREVSKEKPKRKDRNPITTLVAVVGENKEEGKRE